MISSLPADLRDAENKVLRTIPLCLNSKESSRWSVNLKFEGLKILQVVIRLSASLNDISISHAIAFPDAGATALAKRDYPAMKDKIYSFKDFSTQINNVDPPSLLIAVQPQPSDYDEFEKMTLSFSENILMINGRLEDPLVGIGSVARSRRKSFISSWLNSYWLEPLKNGALQHEYPEKWNLYSYSSSGYSFQECFNEKPSADDLMDKL